MGDWGSCRGWQWGTMGHIIIIWICHRRNRNRVGENENPSSLSHWIGTPSRLSKWKCFIYEGIMERNRRLPDVKFRSCHDVNLTWCVFNFARVTLEFYFQDEVDFWSCCFCLFFQFWSIFHISPTTLSVLFTRNTKTIIIHWYSDYKAHTRETRKWSW